MDEKTGVIGVEPTEIQILRPDYFTILLNEYGSFRSHPFYTYDIEPFNIAIQIANSDGNTATENITILPADPGKDCSGKTAGSLDKWICKNTQPIYTDQTFTTKQSHIDSLPDGLSYEKSKYEIVFEDDFLGTGDMRSLNDKLWFSNREENLCGASISNSNLHMEISDRCRKVFYINTEGKFEYIYGYFEVKFTNVMNKALKTRRFNVISWGRYSTLDEIAKSTLGGYATMLFEHICDGNDRVAKVSRYTSILGIEMDIFEFVSNWRQAHFVFHYGNAYEGNDCHNPGGIDSGMWPFDHTFGSYPQTPWPKSVSYKIGFEWTPKGYKIFRNNRRGSPYAAYTGEFQHYGVHTRNNTDLYRYLDAGSVGDYIQEGISHAPQNILIAFFIDNANTVSIPPEENSIMSIDYIRVYQPRNRYSDMDKVYK